MKAILLNEANELLDAKVPTPEPKADEVLVRIVASGFNPIDYQMRENEYERRYLKSPILGRELSGVVEAIGSLVLDFKVGDAVFCACGSMGSNGTYASYIVVPAAILGFKPDSLSFEEAAALPSVGITALQAFNRLPKDVNHRVLVTGASGGVGNFFLKLLLYAGYKEVLVTYGNEAAKKKLLALGLSAGQLVDYRSDDLAALLYSRNGEKRFDVIMECVGNQLGETVATLLKTSGIYLDVTHFISQKTSDILFSAGATILMISNFRYGADREYSYFKEALQQLKDLFDAGKVSPPEIRVLGGLSAATAEEAHRLLKANKTQGAKLIMRNQD